MFKPLSLIRISSLVITLVVIITVAFDQVTKVMVRSSYAPGESIRVIGNFVRLTYVENEGMAFGIQLGNKVFFTIFSILASIAIIIYLYRIRKENFMPRLALALILGGAIGNLTDRILFGRVTDFIDVGWWPVFNVADIAVSIGMFLLIIVVLLNKEETKIPEDASLAEQEQIVR